MSFRFVSIVAIAGLASAAVFVPWSVVVRIAAIQGAEPGIFRFALGYVLGCIAWGVAGAYATRGPVVRPYLVGPLAGGLAATISAWLVWLPTLHVWTLQELWLAASQPVSAFPEALVGRSTSDLLHYGVIGFWVHTAIGTCAGLLGTIASRNHRQRVVGITRTPVFWPLRLWIWSVAFVVGAVVALQQTEFEVLWTQARGHGYLDPLELLLINGALLGTLVFGVVGGVGTRYVRSALPVLRRFGLVMYLGLGGLAYLLWVGVVPVLAMDLVRPEPSPFFLAYAIAPLLAAVVGGLLVRKDPPVREPYLSDTLFEMLPLFVLTGPLVAGAGLAATAWATLMGPQVWANVLSGVSDWSSVQSSVAEILSLQAFAWVPVLAVVVLEGPFVFLPALWMVRARALKQMEVWGNPAQEWLEGHGIEPASNSETLVPDPDSADPDSMVDEPVHEARVFAEPTVPRWTAPRISPELAGAETELGPTELGETDVDLSDAGSSEGAETQVQTRGREVKFNHDFSDHLDDDGEDNVETERFGTVGRKSRVRSADG